MQNSEVKAEKKEVKDALHAEFLDRIIGSMQQSEAARKLGVTPQVIDSWMTGSWPRPATLLKITKGDKRQAAFYMFGATPKEGSMPRQKKTSSAHDEQPAQHQRIPLTQEEEDAVLGLFLQLAETAILEYPATIALRKIAKRLADDSARASSAQKKGATREAKGASGKEAATEPTPLTPKRRPPHSASDKPPDTGTPKP